MGKDVAFLRIFSCQRMAGRMCLLLWWEIESAWWCQQVAMTLCVFLVYQSVNKSVTYLVHSSFRICFHEVLNVWKPFLTGHSPAIERVRVTPLRTESVVFKSIDTYQKMLNNRFFMRKSFVVCANSCTFASSKDKYRLFRLVVIDLGF